MFGEVSDFLKGLGHHLTDMTPVEVLTLVPLGTLVVVFGLQFPTSSGTVDLVAGRSIGPGAADRRRRRRSASTCGVLAWRDADDDPRRDLEPAWRRSSRRS